MKQCIVEFDDMYRPIFKSMAGETLAICSNWSVSREGSGVFSGGTSGYYTPASMKLDMVLEEGFFAKLQTVETQNVEPIVKLQTEQFEHRAIEVG